MGLVRCTAHTYARDMCVHVCASLHIYMRVYVRLFRVYVRRLRRPKKPLKKAKLKCVVWCVCECRKAALNDQAEAIEDRHQKRRAHTHIHTSKSTQQHIIIPRAALKRRSNRSNRMRSYRSFAIRPLGSSSSSSASQSVRRARRPRLCRYPGSELCEWIVVAAYTTESQQQHIHYTHYIPQPSTTTTSAHGFH